MDHYFQGNKMAVWLAAPSALLLAIQYLAALAFVLWQVRRRGIVWGRTGWLAALLIVGFLGAPGLAAEARFRLPLESLLSTAAGAGLALLAGLRTRSSSLQRASRRHADAVKTCELLGV
jgi:hypothetical protein